MDELREKFDIWFPKDQEAIDGIRPSKSNRSAALVLFGEFSLLLMKEKKEVLKDFVAKLRGDITFGKVHDYDDLMDILSERLEKEIE